MLPSLSFLKARSITTVLSRIILCTIVIIIANTVVILVCNTLWVIRSTAKKVAFKNWLHHKCVLIGVENCTTWKGERSCDINVLRATRAI